MAHVATITIDHTKVPGDLTDYVGLIVPDGSAGYAALYALCLEGGGDIRLFKSDDTTELAREIVSFSVSAETGEIHYKYSGTLSSSVDTPIHVYADGSSADYAVTATYGRNAVWSDYLFVAHDGGGTDSTGSYTPTLNGGITAGGVTGKIGKGTDFDGSNDTIDINAVASDLADIKDMTMSLWANSDTHAASNMYIMGFTSSSGGLPISLISRFSNDNIYLFTRNDANSSQVQLNSGIEMTNGTWFQTHATIDGETNKIYVDGALKATGSVTGNIPVNRFSIGNPIGIVGRDYNGQTDEIRVFNGVKTSNWIAAEHANQNSYSTFYSVAAVAGGSAAQAARRGAVMMM